jgi:hypothetical protein
MVAALVGLAPTVVAAKPPAWIFTEASETAGIAYEHAFGGGGFNESQHISGGAAVGDYDGDGWLDVYAVTGPTGANLLFHNLGNGFFEEVAEEAGVALLSAASSGPVFGDYDGDGHLDLFVGGIGFTPPTLFRNLGDGTFEDATADSGLSFGRSSFSAAFGDYDRDGDLDLAVSHWASPLAGGAAEHLWRNEGDGTFTDVSIAAGLVLEESTAIPGLTFTFTPTFADLDADGWPELLFASDFGVSQIFHNDGDGTFTDVTTAVISDENGMGSAVADYDADGDLDWFVSSIWDPTEITDPHVGKTGNRLYRNLGDGSFEDVTDDAGVRDGSWGWGSTFADVNNDGHLDLFHVNGYGVLAHHGGTWLPFIRDKARLFVADGLGAFTERAEELGVADNLQGRGVAAFDYDRDGDLDLLVANNEGPSRLFRNDLATKTRALAFRLRGRAPNTAALGARIHVTSGGLTQMREIHAGSNFVSADPAEAHVGLGAAKVADEVRIEWGDGAETVLPAVRADGILSVTRVDEDAPTCGGGACTPGGRLASKTECLLEWKVTPTPPQGADGVPGKRVTCTDGELGCDGDLAAGNRECRFTVSLCLNNRDPRLAACAPTDVASLDVLAPKASNSNLAARAAHDALEELIESPAGLGFHPRSPFADATPDRCSPAIEIRVPLGEKRNGEPKAGKVLLKVGAKSRGGQRDVDTMTFECLPSSGPT